MGSTYPGECSVHNDSGAVVHVSLLVVQPVWLAPVAAPDGGSGVNYPRLKPGACSSLRGVSASGLLTEARQGRNPTAGTQEDGRPVLLRWTVYAGTGCCQQRRHCSVGSVRWNRSLPPKR